MQTSKMPTKQSDRWTVRVAGEKLNLTLLMTGGHNTHLSGMDLGSGSPSRGLPIPSV